MKINTFLCLTLAVIAISCIHCNSEKTNNEFRGNSDKLGSNNNYSTINNSAITYGVADIGAYNIPETELSKLKVPTFLPKLPEKFDLPRGGPLENVEEISSEDNYYDGSLNLNKKSISCKVYGNSNDCLKNSSCGWCGSSNSCILGNNLGPLQSCSRSSFVYASPVANLKATVQNTATTDGIKFSIYNQS